MTAETEKKQFKGKRKRKQQRKKYIKREGRHDVD